MKKKEEEEQEEGRRIENDKSSVDRWVRKYIALVGMPCSRWFAC